MSETVWLFPLYRWRNSSHRKKICLYRLNKTGRIPDQNNNLLTSKAAYLKFGQHTLNLANGHMVHMQMNDGNQQILYVHHKYLNINKAQYLKIRQSRFSYIISLSISLHLHLNQLIYFNLNKLENHNLLWHRQLGIDTVFCSSMLYRYWH